jgi:hypothetical protein
MTTGASKRYANAEEQGRLPRFYCARESNSLVQHDSLRPPVWRVRTPAFLSAVSIFVVILGCAQPSTAQMAPGVFADANLPSGAPDPQKGDSIWQVDPITGAVNVKIPFTTTPVGGRGPKIPFALFYNSASTVTLQAAGTYTEGSGVGYSVTCSGSAADATGCSGVSIPDLSGEASQVIQTYAWLTGPYNTTFGPAGPWTTSGPFIYNSYSQLPDQIFTVNPGNGPVLLNDGYGCTAWGPFLFADEGGDMHDMNVEYATFNGPPNNLSYACNNVYSNTTETYLTHGAAGVPGTFCTS